MPEKIIQFQQHLARFQEFLNQFLGEALPRICSGGGDWWEILVRSARLEGGQKSRIKRGQIRELGKLDFVSLCCVLKHNWKAVCKSLGCVSEGREGDLHCDILINFRNRLAHQGAESQLNPGDNLQALLALKKLGEILGAPRDLLDDVNADILEEMRREAGAGDSGSADQPPEATPETRPAPPELKIVPKGDQGISLEILRSEGESREMLEAALKETTFVGIDFGTSTTIASRVFLDPEKGILTSEPIPIPQEDRLGRIVEDHLVPSCISLWEGKLLVGSGAAELKPELSLGVNTWFSFKMELGVDIGPKYSRSKVVGQDGLPEFRTPQDVAAYFFAYLREQIERWVGKNNLPENIRYAVSVPASFEANQRLDLGKVMSKAGIDVAENSMIDEPNAAFVSHLMNSLLVGKGVLAAFCEKDTNILVFDFGAGTCDISVLQVGCKNNRLVSRNLAISQFRALGGDNIDRIIAKNVLWPMIESACVPEGDYIRSAELEQVVLPRLQPAAEQLKVQCSKWIASRAQGGDVSIYRDSDEEIETAPISPIRLRKMRLKLDRPAIKLKEFFKLMDPFLAPDTPKHADPDVISIFEPINNALAKAEIAKDELDMVLFIGGSAQNPLVQDAIQNYFGRFVECVVGRDIRIPVSRGAALHSLAWNGLEMQFIRPITSETIYILTVGGFLHPLIQAGSPIPSEDVAFTDNLFVPKDNQKTVQLPICVSSESKILHTLELKSNEGGGFQAGERITVSAHLDENKLLHVTAKIGQTMVESTLVNPLANTPLTPEESRRLTARQKLGSEIPDQRECDEDLLPLLHVFQDGAQ